MKPKSTRRFIAAAAVTSVLALSSSAFAADRTRADNNTNLDLSGSWDTLPTASDIALWTGIYNTAGSLSAGFTASTPVSWQGIRIGNITGTAAGTVIVGSATQVTGSQVTIGTSGIDLSGSNQDLTLNPITVAIGSTSQTWNLGVGRTIQLGGGNLNGTLTGSGTITLSGSGLVELNPASAGMSNFSGKWIIGSGTTLRTTRNNGLGTNTASDAVTLSGGTLVVGGFAGSGAQGNWSWANPITLTSATNSTISAQNPDATATARSLDFTGAIVGSGNLTFSKTQAGAHTFNLKNFGTTTGGVRTNIMGSGDVTVNGVTLVLYPAGAGAGLSFTHNNNIKLIGGTLQSYDGNQTFAGDISLEGANTIVSNWNGKATNLNGTIKNGGVAGSLTYKPGQSETSNTIFVNGHNTYTGDTTLGDTTGNKGIVVAKYGDAFGTTGTVQIRGAQLQAGTAGITIGNAFSVGAGGFRLGGSNNFTLSGTTSIDGVSRTIGNYGSATITLGNISTITGSVAAFDQAGVGGKIVVNGNISGAGAVAVSAGNVAFNGTTNNYSGTTTISGGTISGTGSITNSVVSMSGGSIRLAGGVTTTSLTLSGGVTFTNTPTVTFASNPVASTVYDVFTYGAGSVTGGNLLTAAWRGAITNDTANKKYIFTAGANTALTWNTTSGTWDNIGTNANWTGSDTKFYDGDSATFNEPASDSIVTLSGRLSPGSVTVANTTNKYTFTGTAGSADITGSTSLVKNNGGTLAIATQQSYTGGTTINGGVLDLTGGGGTSGTIRGTVTVNTGGILRLSTGDATGYNGGATSLSTINLVGGTLDVNTASNQTLGSAVINMTGGSITGIAGSNLDLFGNGSAINTLMSGTTSTISLPTMNLRQDDTVFTIADGVAADDLLISSIIGNGAQGNHNMIKNGDGTMVLSGSNTYTGTTTVNAGTLKLSNSVALQNSSLILSAGSLVFDSSVVSNAFTFGGLSGSSNIALQNNAGSPAAIALTVGSNNASTSYSGVLSGAGALVKIGTGTLTLSGANTYSGVTTIKGNNGTIGSVSVSSIGNGGVAGNLGQATNIAGNLIFGENGVSTGKLTYNGAGESTDRLFTLAGNAILENNGSGALNFTNTGAIAHGGGAHNLNLGGSYIGAANTFSSQIVDGSGTIALIKSGAGTWNLTNSNGYTGGTSISGGVLQLNGTVSGTSSIILTGSDSTLSVGTGGTLTSVGNFTLQGSAATGGVFNQTDGVTNLTTTTANAIVIGGVNNTFGKLNISGGTFNAKGATTQLTYYGSVRGELNVSGSAQANFFGINMNASGSGNGTINLTGGTLNIGTGGITNTGNGTSTINLGAGIVGAFGGDWSSSLAMKLTDASTGVTINTADSVTAAARTITLSGALSDGTAVAGKLNKDGVGTLTLTGTNTYTGLTTISAGTLQIGNGSTTGSIASTSGVTNNATLAYNRSNALTAGYAISGSGVVNQIGAGTTTLTGTNTYTGATNVNVGKLAINGDNSLATGAVTVASGATLAGNGTVGGATTIQSGGIHGPGNSPGVQTFSSDLTYAAGSIFSWDLATAAVGSRGTNYDGVNVGGNLSIDSTVSTGSIFRVVLGTTGSESDAFWNTSHSWDVFHVTGTPTGAFANFNVVDSGFAPVTIGSPGSFTYNGATGSLDWSAVPEPTSALAGLLIAAGLLRRRRVA